MIWHVFQIIIGIALVHFATDMFIYYFGWIDYDEEKEKKRKEILDECGIIILLCGIVMDIGGLVILYFGLSVLMYSG